jgi:hypothetical protein
MPLTISDPALLVRLAGMRGMVELKDPDKNCVGRIQTMWPDPVPPRARYHFVDHVSDPDLLAEFARVGEPVEVFDPNGNRIGLFERTWYGKPPIGFKSPFTDDEIAERRKKYEGGLTLAEVWKMIHEKYVGDDVEPIIVNAHDAI